VELSVGERPFIDPKEKLRVVTLMHCIALGDISGGTLDV